MTIRLDIKDALKVAPRSMKQLADITGHGLDSITNAKGYLQGDGIVRQVPGQKPGSPDILYEVVPIRSVSHHGNVLKSPPYVPPKATHRPVYDVAPGVVLREGITGRELADRRMAFAVA